MIDQQHQQTPEKGTAMRYVIVGASAAGMQAAIELRGLDPSSLITVISAEPHYPYSRCLISRYVEGKLRPEELCFKTSHAFEDHRISARLGQRVESVDRQGSQVVLQTGETVPYDRLLLATGARPFVPPIPGIDLGGVHSFHSLADAEKIVEEAENADQIVVLGAGFAGLEAAYALARRGKSVTVVERMGQILPNQLDAVGSEIIQRDLEGTGVHILLNISVASITGDGRARSVTLTDNSSLPADMVIVSVGTRPNVDLAQAAGLTTGRGITVDAYMRTSDPHIYAAGDVIEIDDVTTGRRMMSATWPNAILQGRYAAANMAGRRRMYTDAVGVQNAVQFHHLPAISYGQTLVGADVDETYQVMTRREGDTYRKLVLRDGTVRGMIFVGDIAKAGFYAALIRHRVDVSAQRERLLDDDYSYAAVWPQNSFGQENPYVASTE